ncbi:MAG: C39 family peptidase [Huintestinicola sp.]
MKKSQIGIIIFFGAVLVLSVVLLIKNPDNSSVEVINLIPEEELTDSPNDVRGGHDIDNYFPDAPETDSDETVTAASAEEYLPIEESQPAESETQTVTETETTTSRTVITSRQRKEYDSNSVYLDFENILQNPELPTGCEITALTILLRKYGFDAEKTDLAKNYLPKSWGNPRTVDGKLYKDSFFDYFIGDPFSTGYGCFSPAIEKAARSYIDSHGGGYTVKNISGCHPDTLYEYLIAGMPVLCWATDGMIEPEYYETWYDNATGKQLDWYLNEHCFVLAGFNISASTVTLNDPMKGIIDYNIDKFEVRFKQMHSQAIVILPDNAAVNEEETTVTAAVEVTEETTEEVTEQQETDTAQESTSEDTESFFVDTDFYTGTFIE